MSMSCKLDPQIFETNRKEVIVFLVNSVGFVVFFLFGINAIVSLHEENKDGPHENSQFFFVVCASAVAMQTAFLFFRTMWNFESIVSMVAALILLPLEVVGFFILSHVIDCDVEYRTYLVFLQVLLPICALVGIFVLLSSEDGKEALNQVEKLRIDNKKTDDGIKSSGLNQVEKCHIDNKKNDDRIKLLEGEKRNLEMELLESKTENEKLVVKLKEMQESKEDETKAKHTKLIETEKKKVEIDLAVKREKEELQKDNDVSRKELEALTRAHSLQAEKLRKMEEEAVRVKAEIRALKKLHEYDYSKREENLETIAMLTYKNERREAEINKIEKNCAELEKNMEDLRKNYTVFVGDGEKAFQDAEQALILSLLLLQQQL